MEGITTMLDTKAVVGTALTTAAASTSWLEVAEPIVTMTVTLIVGAATLWYSVERALKLRKERKNDKGKENPRPKSRPRSDGGSMGGSP